MCRYVKSLMAVNCVHFGMVFPCFSGYLVHLMVLLFQFLVVLSVYLLL